MNCHMHICISPVFLNYNKPYLVVVPLPFFFIYNLPLSPFPRIVQVMYFDNWRFCLSIIFSFSTWLFLLFEVASHHFQFIVYSLFAFFICFCFLPPHQQHTYPFTPQISIPTFINKQF